MKTKVYLSGSQGFIGQNLINDQTMKKRIDFLTVQSKKPSALTKADVFLHLAAKVHSWNEKLDYEVYFKSNVSLTLKWAQRAYDAGIKRFIFMSSAKVYGNGGGLFSESSECDPQDYYAQSKFEAENRLKAFFQKRPEMDLIILRLPIVYGPSQKGNMLKLLNAAKKGYPLPLGCALQTRSILGIQNFKSALLSIIEHKKAVQNVFNLADKEAISPKTLYQLCLKKYHRKAFLIPIPITLFKPFMFFSSRLKASIQALFFKFELNCSAFEYEFKWEAPFNVRQGL